MTSKLPAGHYQNLIDAIRKLATAHEAAAQAARLAAETSAQRRNARFSQMKSEQALNQRSGSNGP